MWTDIALNTRKWNRTILGPLEICMYKKIYREV
jgi:hypothetical protein